MESRSRDTGPGRISDVIQDNRDYFGGGAVYESIPPAALTHSNRESRSKMSADHTTEPGPRSTRWQECMQNTGWSPVSGRWNTPEHRPYSPRWHSSKLT